MVILQNQAALRKQLDDEIQAAIKKLGPEAVHVAYRVREDSTGDPSIFFKITLADPATSDGIRWEATDRIRTILRDGVQPEENWGLHAYFNFRSESSLRERPDPDWN
jgi:hypothetical protein